jgi:hypothetical protein
MAALSVGSVDRAIHLDLRSDGCRVISVPLLLALLPIALLFNVGLQASAGQRDSKLLTELTLPESRLATGCRLVPAPTEHLAGKPVRGGMWAGFPIPTNPWAGTDRHIVAAIREQVDPPPVTPDPPALDSRGNAAFRLRLADGVEAAYAAIYGSDEPFLVVVLAIRFGEEGKPLTASTDRSRSTAHFASGRTLIGISGEQSRCFPAVVAYVKEMMNR